MAWNKIGSGQIKDGAILAQHIGVKEVDGTHIADNAITDAHLDIDWAAKASDILSAKKVVDYVQASAGTIAAGSGSITLTDVSLAEAATDNDLGVIINGPNNKVILLEKNEPSKLLIDPSTGEVIFGRMATGLEVSFFILKDGVETAYTFTDAVEYNLQFPVRFTLDTVSEMFAANEKFVDGVADVTTRLDIAQLATDIFGAGYTLNKDGQPTLASGQTISEVMDAIKTLAEQNADDIDAVELVLQGTTENPTSGLVSKVTVLEAKVADIEALDLDTRITSLEDENLATRLKGIEDANFEARVKAVEDINADTRLGELENEIASLQIGGAPIAHRANKKADTEVASYNLVTDFAVEEADAPLADTVDVYVNGMLQMAAEHYTEVVTDGVVTALDFNPNTVKVGDVVQLRWMR